MAFSFFDNKATNQDYIHVVTSMKDVMLVTAKTRGLTNSFNNGNVAAQLLVYAQREAMAKDLKILEDAVAKAKFPAAEIDAIESLGKKLKSLNRKAFRKNPADVFVAYTKVIDEMLALNTKIIDAHFKNENPAIYKPLAMMNNTLLPLVENIGKLRGMGSGIVARGHCNENEVSKMKHFSQEIEKYRLEMVAYYKSNGCRRFSTRKLVHFDKEISDFTKLTNEKVIGQENITLDANKYFDQGTESIKDIMSIYNAMLEEVNKQL